MTPVTICCLLVKGEYPYTPEYVRRLAVMVKRHCTRPYRFVCVTDQPEAMPHGVDVIPTTRLEGCFALWTKVQLFDIARQWTGRVLYLDLDTLVIANLDPIIDFPAAIALTEDAFVAERADINTDRYGRRLIRRFNGSVMVWNAGEQSHIWDRWSLDAAQRLSTDQDWIAEQTPEAVPMPLSWFPRASRVQPPWPENATVVLAKKPKGFEAVKKWPWFNAAWGGWEPAPCN